MKIIFIFVLLFISTFISTVGNVLGQKNCPQMLLVSARFAIARNCNRINPKRVQEAMTSTIMTCKGLNKNYDYNADFKTGMDAGNKLSCDDFNNKLFKTIIVQYENIEIELIKLKCPFKHSR